MAYQHHSGDTLKLNGNEYTLQRPLGAGASSEAWLAQDVDEAIVVLKILRSGLEEKWWRQMEAEARVMASLWESEDRIGDGVHVIPKVIGYTREGERPAFLVMEFVSYPSVLEYAGTYADLSLQKTLEELKAREEQIRLERLNLARKLGVTWGEGPANWQNFENRLKQLSETAGSSRLSDEELIDIGIGVSRALQLLHEQGYGYKDFQLDNVRWKKEKGVKVIDWNTLTKRYAVEISGDEIIKGNELIQEDIYKLASSLFWLRTSVRPPKEGATPEELARIGGVAWREHTSVALRLILERALSPNIKDRYQFAFASKSCEKSSANSVVDTDSFGDALCAAKRWHSMANEGDNAIVRASNLMTQLVGAEESNRGQDVWAIYDIIERKVRASLEGNDDIGQKIIEQIDSTSKKIDAYLNADHPHVYTLAIDRLRAGNLSDAKQQLARIVERDRTDIQAWRWYYVASRLADAGSIQKDLDYLWNDDRLPRLLAALSEQDWYGAEAVLDKLNEAQLLQKFKLDDFEKELEIGRILSRAKCLWPDVSQCVSTGNFDEPVIEQFFNEINNVSLVISQEPAQEEDNVSYLKRWLEQEWTEWKIWQQFNEELKERRQEFNNGKKALADLVVTQTEQNLDDALVVLKTFRDNDELARHGLKTTVKLLETGARDQLAMAGQIVDSLCRYQTSTLEYRNALAISDIIAELLALQCLLEGKDWRGAMEALEELKKKASNVGEKSGIWDNTIPSKIAYNLVRQSVQSSPTEIWKKNEDDWQRTRSLLQQAHEKQVIDRWKQQLDALMGHVWLLSDNKPIVGEDTSISGENQNKVDGSFEMSVGQNKQRNARTLTIDGALEQLGLWEKEWQKDWGEELPLEIKEKIRSLQANLDKQRQGNLAQHITALVVLGDQALSELRLADAENYYRDALDISADSLQTENIQRKIDYVEILRKKLGEKLTEFNKRIVNIEGYLKEKHKNEGVRGIDLRSWPAISELASMAWGLSPYRGFSAVEEAINRAIKLVEQYGLSKDDFWDLGKNSVVADLREKLKKINLEPWNDDEFRKLEMTVYALKGLNPLEQVDVSVFVRGQIRGHLQNVLKKQRSNGFIPEEAVPLLAMLRLIDHLHEDDLKLTQVQSRKESLATESLNVVVNLNELRNDEIRKWKKNYDQMSASERLIYLAIIKYLDDILKKNSPNVSHDSPMKSGGNIGAASVRRNYSYGPYQRRHR